MMRLQVMIATIILINTTMKMTRAYRLNEYDPYFKPWAISPPIVARSQPAATIKSAETSRFRAQRVQEEKEYICSGEFCQIYERDVKADKQGQTIQATDEQNAVSECCGDHRDVSPSLTEGEEIDGVELQDNEAPGTCEEYCKNPETNKCSLPQSGIPIDSYKIQCKAMCRECKLPSTCSQNVDSVTECTSNKAKAYDDNGEAYCCEETLEIKDLKYLDKENDCEQTTDPPSPPEEDIEEIMDGTNKFRCKSRSYYKLMLRDIDREKSSQNTENIATSSTASSTASSTTTGPHGHMCCDLYRQLGPEFVSIDEVKSALEEADETNMEEEIEREVQDEQTQIDNLLRDRGPGVCCLEFMERRTKHIKENEVDNALLLLKQFLNAVVIPVGTREMTTEEFSNGMTKMSEQFGSDVWELLIANIRDKVEGLNVMLKDHATFWSAVDDNVPAELGRLRQEKDGIQKIIDKYESGYKSVQDEEGEIKRKEMYDRFVKRKNDLNMGENVPDNEATIKPYIETHRERMKSMTDL